LRSGGLGEATAWLCLREEIYVSLLTQKSIRSSLDTFEGASWVQGDSDAAWANRMVLLLAQMLVHVFDTTVDTGAVGEMKDRITDWYRSKPHSFEPIYYQRRNLAAGRPLPEIWMLASFHAVAVQYYHIAQLVLTVSVQMSSSRFLEYLHEHRAIEQRVRQHLLHVVGIAASNKHAQNTWFTAHHCLAVWGGSLRRQTDQEACLDFLRRMEHKTGWRVAALVGRLSSQWYDDSE